MLTPHRMAVIFEAVLAFVTLFCFTFMSAAGSPVPPQNVNTNAKGTITSTAEAVRGKPPEAVDKTATTPIDFANFISKAPVKGIYVTQYNLENTAFLTHLIKRANAAGVNTFVVDLELPSKRYKENIGLLKDNHIHYVARIIMFPGGASHADLENPAYWQKKYGLVKQAVDWGADEIQLDYIRYSSKEKASDNHATRILEIIQWYKNKLVGQNIPLQIDVFGVTSFGESKHIGQNIKLFSQSVDAICPMVYPSHYVPFPYHFQRPYETVYNSLRRIKKQFDDQVPMKVYAYIELSNYHYPMTREKTLDYIKAQLKAVDEAGADGWYAWSPHNRYDNLFNLLETQRTSSQ